MASIYLSRAAFVNVKHKKINMNKNLNKACICKLVGTYELQISVFHWIQLAHSDLFYVTQNIYSNSLISIKL